MDFSIKLQLLRKKAGLTQDELAVKLGVSRQAISKWEIGDAFPDLCKLADLCEMFSLSADALFNPKNENLEPVEGEIRFDLNTVGINIKNLRIAKGISQEAFAEALNVSRQSVSKWENGGVLPKTEVLIVILELLNVDLKDVLQPISPAEEVAEEPTGELAALFQKSCEEEIGAASEESLASPPAPKRKKRLTWLLWAIPTATVLLAFLVVAGILLYPLLFQDPLINTVQAMLPDTASAEALAEKWEQEGAKITVGKEETEFSVTLVPRGDRIAVGGLTQDGSFVVLPRQNVVEALEDSPLHPTSAIKQKSPAALSYDHYHTLEAILKSLESDYATEEENEAFANTLKAIREDLYEHADSTVRYAFAPEQFAIRKTETLALDKDSLCALLEAVATEIEQNKEMDSLLDATAEGEESVSLSEGLRTFRSTLASQCRSAWVRFTYSTVGGKIESVKLIYDARGLEDEPASLSFDIHFSYEKDAPSFEASVKTSEQKGAYKTVENVIAVTYRNTKTEKGFQISCNADIQLWEKHSGVSKAESTSGSFLLEHDRETNRYTASYSVPSAGLSLRAEGDWAPNTEEGSLRFSLDSLENNGKKVMDTDAFCATVLARGTTEFPEGKNLFEMTAAELRDLQIHFPHQRLDALKAALTGEKSDTVYSWDGLAVTDAAQMAAERYETLLLSYVQSQSNAIWSLYVYDEAHNVYFLLRYHGAKVTSCEYAYAITESVRLEYSHRAYVENNALVVHKGEKVVAEQPATCLADGYRSYRCDGCGIYYRETLPRLPHTLEKTEYTVVTDDGEERQAVVSECTACERLISFCIEDFATVTFQARLTGGYEITGYTPHSSAAEYFSIPDALCEKYSIRWMSNSYEQKASVIRLPKGFSMMPGFGFSEIGILKILIVPSTATSFGSYVFGGSATAPEVIYYCGTEEQWQAVDLGQYQRQWEHVEVIFMPNGVPGEVVAAKLAELNAAQ